MRARYSASEKRNSVAPVVAANGIAERSSMIAAARTDDVLREQLEFLIGHAGEGDCGCSVCDRYAGVRAVLMRAFID